MQDKVIRWRHFSFHASDNDGTKAIS